MQDRKKRPPIRKADPDRPEPLPARTEAEEEKRACGYAMDLAMRWMQEGTAPAQVVVHFLKIASQREQAELEKTKYEIELIKAKKRSIELDEEHEKRYQEVVRAISEYNGRESEWEIVEDEFPEYDQGSSRYYDD